MTLSVSVQLLTPVINVRVTMLSPPSITVEGVSPITVEVNKEGIQGPAGADASTFVYLHTQSSASATWTINHNLGFRPGIELFNSAGSVFIGEILHTSINQAIVYLNTSISGSARCN